MCVGSEDPVRVCDRCCRDEAVTGSSGLEQSMSDCPVCGVEFGVQDSEEHLRACLATERESIVGSRFVVFTLVKEESAGGECSICFEEFANGDRVARMNCLCVFHHNCLEGRRIDKFYNHRLVCRTARATWSSHVLPSSFEPISSSLL